MQHGVTPKLNFDIAVDYQKDDEEAFNVIGEIPGTTKPDEVVMLGGHFDSWQGGTGATDNGTGSSVAMEAMRILATLHKPMARTVRVALWGGEEEGVYGSTAYVQQHFAQRTTMVKTPEYDKLDVYFNDDGGSGRFRGVSAGGSPQMAAIFKSWIEPIKDQHIVAVSGGDQFRPTASPRGTDSSAVVERSLMLDRALKDEGWERPQVGPRTAGRTAIRTNRGRSVPPPRGAA